MISAKKLSIALTLLFFGLTLAPAITAAQYTAPPANSGAASAPANSGDNAAPANSGNNSIFGIQNPLGNGTDSFCKLIRLLLNVIIIFGIPIATLFLVYAGFKLILSRGNPEALKKARENLMWVIIGIGIFLGAWLLGQVIANTIIDLNVNISGFNNC